MQKSSQFQLKFDQVNFWCGAAFEFGDLAIDAAPVAGIIGIKVNADRHTACAARYDRVNVDHAGAVAVMIGNF